MDYLDPKKQTRQSALLFTGYFLIGLAILIGTFILVYQAYGFGVSRDGQVVQSGLVFFSSKPNPANIYLNGKLYKDQTNTRLVLPENIYSVQIKRDGYRDWKREIGVEGGSVRHYDYPFLFPTTLETKNIYPLSSAPNISTQSPDRRWLVLQLPGPGLKFNIYDLKNIKTPPVEITVPSTAYTKTLTTDSWQFSEWADDNNHFVLIHQYDGKKEFVLVNRKEPTKSLNISKTLNHNFSELTLADKKYDQYFLYDNANLSLKRGTLNSQELKDILAKAYAYKTYGNDSFLLVTDTPKKTGKVQYVLKIKDKEYVLKEAPTDTGYLLDLTEYSGKLYVVIGAVNGDKVYVYKDPIASFGGTDSKPLAPIQVFHISKPNYVKFSSSAQFVLAQNGNQFAIYDAENDKGFKYNSKQPIDAPQQHANWMDGNRLMYVSGGKVFVFDYDFNNRQFLNAASSSYEPFFSSDYKFLYTINPVNSQLYLTQTSLLTKADQ